MRHRTALPFLDAFLKPTKHIRSGLFLHYRTCNFCEIEIKNHSRGIFENQKRGILANSNVNPISGYLKPFLELSVLASTPLASFLEYLLELCRF